MPFDSITDSGVVWVDDNMACERVVRVMYDAKNPRIEYTIRKTDFVGIFDNQEQLKQFECNWQTCKRYARNCSILKKTKEGRIQEEIQKDADVITCQKYSKVKGDSND